MRRDFMSLKMAHFKEAKNKGPSTRPSSPVPFMSRGGTGGDGSCGSFPIADRGKRAGRSMSLPPPPKQNSERVNISERGQELPRQADILPFFPCRRKSKDQSLFTTWRRG